MANIGDRITTPEAGWKRIDDTDSKIVYKGTGWNEYPVDVTSSWGNNSCWNNTRHYTKKIDNSVSFNVKSSKIRIFSGFYYDIPTTSNVNIYINDELVSSINLHSNNTNIGICGQRLMYENLNLSNEISHIVITLTTDIACLTLDCIDIDEDGYLLTEEEYNQVSYISYIKQDDKYYGFSDDNYDTTTKMYKEVTLDNIKNLEYSNLISNLTKETTIGDETFKPIDKFTNFQLISPYSNEPKTIIGSKSKSGLIVANGDIYAGRISDRINSFTLEYTVNNNSAIKMAVSFDNGSTWKTYKDGAFQELSITIPNKYYANMTDEEKTNYSNAKTTILESGFNVSDLSSIDFNIDNLDTIRFAYVLYQDSINDDCKMSDLSWNFNAKGYLQKMKDSEVDTSFCNGIIKITPLIDCEMIITNYNY